MPEAEKFLVEMRAKLAAMRAVSDARSAQVQRKLDAQLAEIKKIDARIAKL